MSTMTETLAAAVKAKLEAPETSYRIECACGGRFGYANDLLGPVGRAEAIRLHGAHAKSKRRQEARLPVVPSHEVKTTEALSPAERAAEQREWDRRWAELLRDEQLPKKRAEVYAGIKQVAEDLRRHAEAIDRLVTRADTRAAAADADDTFHGPLYDVEQAQHEVLWGVANLGLDRLIGRAQEYEATKRELAQLTRRLAEPSRAEWAAALRRWARYGAENGGDEAYHDADGTGWVSASRALLGAEEAKP